MDYSKTLSSDLECLLEAVQGLLQLFSSLVSAPEMYKRLARNRMLFSIKFFSVRWIYVNKDFFYSKNRKNYLLNTIYLISKAEL